MGIIANRQSLAFNERSQLSQAIPKFHVERILHQRTPIARFESQSNERRVYEDPILCFFGRGYDRQRTLAIRIAAITLASDSAITLARFRPSKIFRKQEGVGFLQKCTPLLAVALRAPNVLLGPLSPDIFCFLGRGAGPCRNPLCENPLFLALDYYLGCSQRGS